MVTGKVDVREAAASLPEVEHLDDDNRVDGASRATIGAESA